MLDTEQIQLKVNFNKFSNDFLFTHYQKINGVVEPEDKVLVEITKILCERGVLEIPWDKLDQ